ncbi:uncharacterized protein [Anoplolepis gracilipes]|uniref:uncharacterized protein n=1 Tax=Anoplolepis gracilipes TaxID=354296 RepID=UPI003B9F1256
MFGIIIIIKRHGSVVHAQQQRGIPYIYTQVELSNGLTCRLRLVLQFLWTEDHGVDGNDSGGGYTDGGGGRGRGGEKKEKKGKETVVSQKSDREKLVRWSVVEGTKEDFSKRTDDTRSTWQDDGRDRTYAEER